MATKQKRYELVFGEGQLEPPANLCIKSSSRKAAFKKLFDTWFNSDLYDFPVENVTENGKSIGDKFDDFVDKQIAKLWEQRRENENHIE